MSCVVCHKGVVVLHDHCVDELLRLASSYCRSCADPHQSPVCEWCYTPPSSYESLRAPYLMDGPVRELVHGLKYRNMKAWAPRIAELMADYLSRLSVDPEVLVPVPLHPKRIRERGFNQSELLAKEMGKRLGLPVETGLLARTKDTPAQISTSTQEERPQQHQGGFRVHGRRSRTSGAPGRRRRNHRQHDGRVCGAPQVRGRRGGLGYRLRQAGLGTHLASR